MNNIDKFYTKNTKDFSKNYIMHLKKVIDNIDHDSIDNFINIILNARDNKSTIYFIGNGGSASTASHFANDLSIGTNDYNKPLKVISLTDNVAIISAIGNDFGYDDIFLRQVKVYAKPGDVLVAISASGNSNNLLSAIKYANDNNIVTVSMTAFDGGKLRSLTKNSIHVSTELKEYGPAEDAHLIINHLVMSYLKRYFENEEKE